MKNAIFTCVFGFLMLQGGMRVAFAQEQESGADEKDYKTSVDLTYEANNELEEDFANAEATYRKAIAKSDKNTAARYNLGNAYYNKNSLGEAFMRYKEAGESALSKEEKHKAFHNMGNVFMKNEEYEKAVEAYKEALRNNPSDEETRYNLALAKEKLKKQQQENQQDQNDQNQDNKDNQDKENQDSQDQQDQNQDQQDQNQEGGDQDENEDKGDPKNEGDQKEEQQKEGEGKDEQKQQDPQEGEGQPQQPRQSQLSPQQIKNILEAMNNEEKKVQEKINARKVKGTPVKSEKDW